MRGKECFCALALVPLPRPLLLTTTKPARPRRTAVLPSLVSTSKRARPRRTAEIDNTSFKEAPPYPLSSRPKRTRISCHAALDKSARAPFSKEGRMKCDNATKFNRKSGGA
jgi:hypothetical protein